MAVTPEANLKVADFGRNYGLHRSSAVEIWHVKDVTGWNDSNTVDVVYARIPRMLGASHPDPRIGQAICINFSIKEKWTTTVDTVLGPVCDAYVAVTFDTNHSESFRLSNSGSRGYTGTVVIPNWTNSGGVWFPYSTTEQREYLLRVETHYFRSGAWTDAVEQQAQNKVGSVFHFPLVNSPDPFGGPASGTPYLLKSPQVADMPNDLTRVIYTFVTSCPIIAMPAGTLTGQDKDLPALDYLQEYFCPRGFVGPNSVPIDIQARPWHKRYPWSHEVLPRP